MKHLLILAAIFLILPLQTLAQSDGSSKPTETPLPDLTSSPQATETPSSASDTGTSAPTQATVMPTHTTSASRTVAPSPSSAPSPLTTLTSTPRPSASITASPNPTPSASSITIPTAIPLNTAQASNNWVLGAVIGLLALASVGVGYVMYKGKNQKKNDKDDRCGSIKELLEQKKKELEDFIRKWPEEKIKAMAKDKVMGELKKDEDAKRVIETAESLKAKHDKLKETIELLEKKYNLCMLELPVTTNQIRLSYLMGAENIQDKELENLGIKIADKTTDGDWMLRISEKELPKYIELIKSKLGNGFWNEIIGAKEIIFIFKFKDGLVKEYQLSPDNESKISELCTEFNNDPLEKTANVYKYISKNKFYHDFMMEHYADMIKR